MSRIEACDVDAKAVGSATGAAQYPKRRAANGVNPRQRCDIVVCGFSSALARGISGAEH
jgi:hypothetical protein